MTCIYVSQIPFEKNFRSKPIKVNFNYLVSFVENCIAFPKCINTFTIVLFIFPNTVNIVAMIYMLGPFV